MDYADVVVQGLRETLHRPLGYIDENDEKYGKPPLDPNFERYDPNKPADVLFNRPPAPEPTMGDWLAWRQREERKRYGEELWHDAIGRIRARQFPTRRDIGKQYGKSSSWASQLVSLMVQQRVFSAGDLRELLPGRGSRLRKLRPSGKAAHLTRLDQMTREGLEQVLYERDPSLTLSLLVAMLRGRSFRSVTGFSGHFFRPSYWGRAVGQFLERERLLAAGEFRLCFEDRRGRAGVAVRGKKFERAATTAAVFNNLNSTQEGK